MPGDLAQLQDVANERDGKWARLGAIWRNKSLYKNSSCVVLSRRRPLQLGASVCTDERWAEYQDSIPLPTESEEMPKSMTARRAMLWENLRTGNQRTMF